MTLNPGTQRLNTIPYIFGRIDEPFQEIIRRFGLSACDSHQDALFVLEFEDQCLQLRSLNDKGLGAFAVEFAAGKAAHRRIFGSYRNEAIVKAVGFKRGSIPAVLDLTAGFGRDAFVLASAGCRVHLLERCNLAAALLDDALRRAGQDVQIGSWIHERLTLSRDDALKRTRPLPFVPDVVYIDAMFPQKQGSALARKEIRLLQMIAGTDNDQDCLLEEACHLARRRVVVKRPNFARYLNQEKPQFSIESKHYRFDVYIISSDSAKG